MDKRHKNYKLALFTLLPVGFLLLFAFLVRGGHMVMFNPQGIIAQKERSLMLTAILLMLIIVVPVFGFTIFVARKYRAGNPNAAYAPTWVGNTGLEFLWWALPSAIIFALSILTWQSTHELDPFKTLSSANKPITIQVVALQWKWLFIYPEQNIATVNFIEFPVNTPVNFELTADAPMNTFWIPQLGGQVYAMAGMKTQLHLLANKVGEFNGSSSEISGAGFAGMKFVAKATSQNDFDKWIKSVQLSSTKLDMAQYDKLTKPSENNPKVFYAPVETDLQNSIMGKFMAPTTSTNTY